MAINELKCGKAPGLDKMFAEFIKHFGLNVKHWLLTIFNEILNTGRLPKIFNKSKVIAALKPGKNGTEASYFRPISLLSIPYKLLEKLLLNRIHTKINEIVPIEQAGFRPNRSCCEQVLALTTYIEKGFQTKKKSFVMFVDLSAAYDKVWKHGLLYKLIHSIPSMS